MSTPTPNAQSSTTQRPQRSSQKPAAKRTGLKSFLTPGWALALILVIAFSYFAITALAPWQLGKNEKNSATNQRLQEAFERDPVPLSDVVANTETTVPEDDEWTHVTMQGTFATDQDVVLRNRHVEGTMVYQILTPFHTDSGIDIMVNRGFVAPTNSGKIPEYPSAEPQETTVSGYLRLDESTSDEKPAEFDEHTVVNSISAKLNEQAVGEDLVNGYVQLDEASTQEGLLDVALPQLDSGPYLSYGIQWIAFGIIAPAGLGWFVYSEVKERRREKREQQDLVGQTDDQNVIASATGTTDAEESDHAGEQDGVQSETQPETRTAGTAQPAAAQESIDRKLADRYGKAAKRANKGSRRDGGTGERF